jgi:outer membrane protein TolC
MAGAPTLDRAEVKTISASLQAALAAAEAAGYRIDLLIGQPDEDQPDEDLPAESAAKPASTETPEGMTAKTETSAEPEPATEVHKV